MYKEEKYIAISFLLVFLLPGVYQPFHVIEHHGHKHHCSHGICSLEEPGHPVFQKDEHCFVCDFEFTLSDLPREFNNLFCEYFLRDVRPLRVQDIFSFEVILSTSPRAPPFFA
ncbi:hypothetical protein GM418_10010 [Maribellus comscasis]|uniref:Uncharacterized protein n=1 Tax=Maribellus comscasis TaxID=2681766 RepID=A0A6I6JSC7_9BACT|nr:hypothetical protein [Maribellus comscasis]QGY43978.1 hypothetical protein GM418_10010 [Maribellus comscasis]